MTLQSLEESSEEGEILFRLYMTLTACHELCNFTLALIHMSDFFSYDDIFQFKQQTIIY